MIGGCIETRRGALEGPSNTPPIAAYAGGCEALPVPRSRPHPRRTPTPGRVAPSVEAAVIAAVIAAAGASGGAR